MSVEDLDKIDLIGVTADGAVVLTITDHLEWDNEHLFTLQEKINCYLRFLESGEIYESYPKAKDAELIISLVCKYEPNAESQNFLSKCEGILNSSGFGFKYSVS